MVDKGIKKHLQYKINDWISHLEKRDPNLAKKVAKEVIVTGGAIVNLFQNEKPKDYDIYLKTKETVKELAEFYVNWHNEIIKEGSVKGIVLDGADPEVQKAWSDHNGHSPMFYCQPGRIKIVFPSNGVSSAEREDILEEPFEDYFDAVSQVDEVSSEEVENKEEGKEKYRPVFMSSNAITLSNKIQIVIRFYGEAEDIHETYDFLHCTAWYDYYKNQLNYTKEVLRSIMDKRLVYRGSEYPVCSIIRLRKFISRGWHVNAGQILKALFQVSELDLKDINVLEDQLVGVDSAYFEQLIAAINTKQEKDENFVLTSGYLASIIDKIFS
jgi:hypothetical protein